MSVPYPTLTLRCHNLINYTKELCVAEQIHSVVAAITCCTLGISIEMAKPTQQVDVHAAKLQRAFYTLSPIHCHHGLNYNEGK